MELLKVQNLKQFVFKPIDLISNIDITIKFRTDAFACSFKNSETRWGGDKQVEEYITWLEAKLQNDPSSAMHVWSGTEIIGQVELGEYKHDKKIGYVYLYYLIPQMRGTNASTELHVYALSYLRKKGYKSARLSVGKTNQRAINFYSRLEWYPIGDRPDDSEALMMELLFEDDLNN